MFLIFRFWRRKYREHGYTGRFLFFLFHWSFFDVYGCFLFFLLAETRFSKISPPPELLSNSIANKIFSKTTFTVRRHQTLKQNRPKGLRVEHNWVGGQNRWEKWNRDCILQKILSLSSMFTHTICPNINKLFWFWIQIGLKMAPQPRQNSKTHSLCTKTGC